MDVRVMYGLILMCPSIACAQSAIMRVSHNDPDGIVERGQTVQITAMLSWQPSGVFWEIAGEVRSTGDLGVASSPAFPYNVGASPNRVIQAGTPAAGSILDVHIVNGDAGFLGGWPLFPPWGNASGLIITRYDWTAPGTLGVVGFDWIGEPALPWQPTIYPLGSFTPLMPIGTTYVGTSLTVVPGVGSGVVLAAGLAMGRRRR